MWSSTKKLHQHNHQWKIGFSYGNICKLTGTYQRLNSGNFEVIPCKILRDCGLFNSTTKSKILTT